MTEIATTFDRQTHSHYRRLIDHAPPGVAFRPLSSEWGHPVGGKVATAAFWKARGAWHRLGGVNVDRYPAKSLGELPIFAAQTIPLHRNPWALDIDTPSALVSFRHELVSRSWFRSSVARSLRRDRCRAITYWSDIARRAMERVIPGVAAKAIPLYPAARPVERDRAPNGEVRVLFVGKNFLVKGGREAFEVAQRVLKRHPRGVRFVFVTDLPPGIKPPEDPRIEIHSRVEQGRLDALFREADVFLFPTLYEVFGVVIIEALAHGLPVVTLDEYAVPEMVTDGVEGFVVAGFKSRWYGHDGVPTQDFEATSAAYHAHERERIVAELSERVDALCRDAGLRQRMADAAQARVGAGGRYGVEAQQAAIRTLAGRFEPQPPSAEA